MKKGCNLNWSIMCSFVDGGRMIRFNTIDVLLKDEKDGHFSAVTVENLH